MTLSQNYSINRWKTTGTVMGVLILILFSYLLLNRPYDLKKTSPYEKSTESEQEDISIHLKDIDQVSVKNGNKEWHLKAVAAKLSQDRIVMNLENPRVTFFRPDGTTIDLSAKKGTLNTRNSHIQVEKDVLVVFGNYKLYSETLLYNHTKEMITTDDIVTIEGLSFRVIADTMTFDLNKKQTLFEGHVKGSFRDQIIP